MRAVTAAHLPKPGAGTPPADSSMSLPGQLQTLPLGKAGDSPAEGSPEEKRFNALIGQIEQARATLATWQEQIPVFHQAYEKRIVPLIARLRESRRAAIELVDALLDQPGWSKAEASGLREWLLERAGEFLEGDARAADPAMRAVFARHGGIDPLAAPPPAGEDAGAEGVGNAADSAAEEDAMSDADFVRRVEEELAAQEARQAAAREEAQAAARATRGESARQKKKSAAQQRREDEAEEATQTVRDIFRKLVSALHPDREADPVRRAEKTGLMQRVNRAYAAQDLLGLLQLQLETAQVDAGILRGASSQRVRHYNQALAAQLADLKAEIQQVQSRFEADFGLATDRLLNPNRLDRLVDQAYQEVAALLAEQQREIRVLADRSATRQWLRGVGRQLGW